MKQRSQVGNCRHWLFLFLAYFLWLQASSLDPRDTFDEFAARTPIPTKTKNPAERTESIRVQ